MLHLNIQTRNFSQPLLNTLLAQNIILLEKNLKNEIIGILQYRVDLDFDVLAAC